MSDRCYELMDPTITTLSYALRNILDPLEYRRRRAEELLKALEVIEQYGMHLVDYICNQDEKIDTRLLSVVLLKQYIEVHWYRCSEKFRRPEITRTAKDYIKSMLPRIFVDPSINLQKNVACVISTIALFEYPDHWPDCFDSIIDIVKNSGERNASGALQTLLEYIINCNDVQIKFILDLLAHLLDIIANSNQSYSFQTRCFCIKMFKHLVPDIKKHIDKNDKYKSTLEDYIHSFLHKFLEVLHTNNDTTNTQHYKLNNNVIQTVKKLIIDFPFIVQPYLEQILPLFWQTLVKASQQYKKQNQISPELVDEDGDIINSDSQIIVIFDFVKTVCVQNTEISNNIYSVLTDLMFHTIVCLQITPIIMIDWNKACENFILDENDCNIDYKVRYAAYSLLNEMMNVLDKRRCVSAFCEALCRHICHAEALRKDNVNDWWQGLEASMYALGSVRDHITVEYNAGQLNDFNLMGYLNTAAQYTQENNIPMLLGRCIWLCGMFCQIMNRDTLQMVVESTVKHLQYSSSIFVRLYALRAIEKYCESKMLPRTQSILQNHLNGILNYLCNTPLQSVSILRLTLEVMIVFVKVNESFTATSIDILVPFAISIFLKYNDDPLTTDLMMQLISVLVQIPNVLPQLQEIFAPTLLSVLNTPVGVATSGIHIVALETLGTLVRNQPAYLNEQFLETLFPAAVHVILHSTDSHVLQAGGECMSNFLFSGAAQQVCVYRNTEGQMGIDFIIDIINKLLDPYSHEYSAKFISLLIIILIVKAGEHLYARLEPLLRAILSKMQCTESDCNMQCLISIFAYLIHTQIDAIMNFLNTIPGPNGEAALEFVLMEWIFTHATISSFEFEYKISIVALIQLFEYGVKNDHYVLLTMAVNDNENTENVDKSDRWIPILAKILKILLQHYKQDLTTQLTANIERQGDECELSSINEKMNTSLMSLLPMLKHLNINEHIRSFFITYKNNDAFQYLYKYFDQSECDKLIQMGVNINSAQMVL